MKSQSLPLWFRIMGTERVLSLRVIASLAVAALVAGTLFAIAHLNEKYTRRALLEQTIRELLEN